MGLGTIGMAGGALMGGIGSMLNKGGNLEYSPKTFGDSPAQPAAPSTGPSFGYSPEGITNSDYMAGVRGTPSTMAESAGAQARLGATGQLGNLTGTDAPPGMTAYMEGMKPSSVQPKPMNSPPIGRTPPGPVGTNQIVVPQQNYGMQIDQNANPMKSAVAQNTNQGFHAEQQALADQKNQNFMERAKAYQKQFEQYASVATPSADAQKQAKANKLAKYAGMFAAIMTGGAAAGAVAGMSAAQQAQENKQKFGR